MNAPLKTTPEQLAPAAVLDGRGDIMDEVASPDLVITGETELEPISGEVRAANVIVIDFPTLMDGRGYSRANALREDFGFEGELRATGDIGVDQLHYLLRSGFTSFALRAGTDVDAARRALRRFSHHYVGVQVQPQDDFVR